MRENRSYGFVPKSGFNIGVAIGGSMDGRRLDSAANTIFEYRFHALRTVHGVSHGFWHTKDKTPVDIILQLANGYRKPRVKK